jgi:hypothetical protein
MVPDILGVLLTDQSLIIILSKEITTLTPAQWDQITIGILPPALTMDLGRAFLVLADPASMPVTVRGLVLRMGQGSEGFLVVVSAEVSDGCILLLRTQSEA